LSLQTELYVQPILTSSISLRYNDRNGVILIPCALQPQIGDVYELLSQVMTNRCGGLVNQTATLCTTYGLPSNEAHQL